MSKKTVQKTKTKPKKYDPAKLVKDAVKKRKWILFVGATSEERERLSKIAHKAEKLFRHKNTSNFKGDSFKKVNLLGCTGDEIYDCAVKELFFLFPYTDVRMKSIYNLISPAKTFFLDNLYCKTPNDESAVKKLAAQLKMFKSSNSKSKLGTLLIGLEDKKYFKNLPKPFIDIFEIINLPSQSKAKKGKLKRGKKQNYVPKNKLLPFIKQGLKYLKSPNGGSLSGGALATRVVKDINNRFGVKYKEGTVKNLISEINTGKI